MEALNQYYPESALVAGGILGVVQQRICRVARQNVRQRVVLVQRIVKNIKQLPGRIVVEKTKYSAAKMG
jgi:hypothetical protein